LKDGFKSPSFFLSTGFYLIFASPINKKHMITESKKKLALREYISSGKSLAEVAKNHSMSVEKLRRYAIEKSAVRKRGRPKGVRGVTPILNRNTRASKSGLNFIALADLVKSHGIKISIVIGSSGTNIKMES